MHLGHHLDEDCRPGFRLFVCLIYCMQPLCAAEASSIASTCFDVVAAATISCAVIFSSIYNVHALEQSALVMASTTCRG